ncbi:primosomal protein N', partial [Candidatus Saccharibacteria bacterium]|nr:primosomal protein N' [Candidatus Saccharibacteria bacterium]
GLDLPKLRTVGVVQADAGLALPDFTSPERNFQLLAQVIGRVGRHASDTNVIVQTYQPNSPSVQFGIHQDYDGFCKHEIAVRRQTNFPPFVYLLKLTCVYKTEKSAIKNSRQAAQEIRTAHASEVQILGPTPAFYERVGDTYRWQIIIKSKKRGELLKIAKKFQTQAHWRIDIDPPSLL